MDLGTLTMKECICVLRHSPVMINLGLNALPPVHPNCRCFIDRTTGEWIDARDSRVCVLCRSIGAQFNAAKDGTLSDEDIDRALDALETKEFRNAVLRDTLFEDDIIMKAGVRIQEGAAANLSTKPVGISAKQWVFDRTEAALARARLRAQVPPSLPRPPTTVGAGVEVVLPPPPPLTPAVPPIPTPPAGAPIVATPAITPDAPTPQAGAEAPPAPVIAPGMPIREAITVEVLPAGVKPVFVKVVIASGNTHIVYQQIVDQEVRIFLAEKETGKILRRYEAKELAIALNTFNVLEGKIQ